MSEWEACILENGEILESAVIQVATVMGDASDQMNWILNCNLCKIYVYISDLWIGGGRMPWKALGFVDILSLFNKCLVKS